MLKHINVYDKLFTCCFFNPFLVQKSIDWSSFNDIQAVNSRFSAVPYGKRPFALKIFIVTSAPWLQGWQCECVGWSTSAFHSSIGCVAIKF